MEATPSAETQAPETAAPKKTGKRANKKAPAAKQRSPGSARFAARWAGLIQRLRKAQRDAKALAGVSGFRPSKEALDELRNQVDAEYQAILKALPEYETQTKGPIVVSLPKHLGENIAPKTK